MTPPDPIKGWRGLLPWLNDLRDWCISIRPIRSETCEVHETDSGTQILPRAVAVGAGGAAAAASPKLFELSDASVGATLKVKVTASTLNAGAITEQLFTVTASGKVYAHIHDNADYVEDTREILNGASVPAETEHDGYFEIGSYTVSGSTLTVENLNYGPISHRNTTDVEHEWVGSPA